MGGGGEDGEGVHMGEGLRVEEMGKECMGEIGKDCMGKMSACRWRLL